MMKKFMLTVVVLIAAFRAEARLTCEDIILNGAQDSHTHQVRVDDIVIDDSLKFVSNIALHRLLLDAGCQVKDLKLPRCGFAVKGNPLTEICYSESKYGYFIVQKDYLDNLNIIVNRWD